MSLDAPNYCLLLIDSDCSDSNFSSPLVRSLDIAVGQRYYYANAPGIASWGTEQYFEFAVGEQVAWSERPTASYLSQQVIPFDFWYDRDSFQRQNLTLSEICSKMLLYNKYSTFVNASLMFANLILKTIPKIEIYPPRRPQKRAIFVLKSYFIEVL